ncbi:hypothetical protein WN48_05638 [Eufriesea mexicana]|uniref:Uncharacterized protein n=1 Tax=Eufriesea mexicana TaxID=516756 RepID=A0A310SL08_9HYME|nr:hypothetical protein WN48_05638 [Eufriesea mexicana]
MKVHGKRVCQGKSLRLDYTFTLHCSTSLHVYLNALSFIYLACRRCVNLIVKCQSLIMPDFKIKTRKSNICCLRIYARSSWVLPPAISRRFVDLFAI